MAASRGPRIDRPRLAAAALALVAAGVALLVAGHVFPHRSLNHDEGVYLQQAAMLLDGRLFLRPPVEDAFRPWFFVESDRGLYPKYAPVTAGVFAVGKLLGGYPVALAGVAAGVVALTAGLGRELYDARTGLLAGAFVLASPLFLVHAGVYLPYATTTALNLAFALAYLRAERLASPPLAALAGAAVGLAFFARPYTAVLFAAPFVVHAGWTLARELLGRVGADAEEPRDARRSGGRRSGRRRFGRRSLLGRRLATAGVGLLGVLVALGYNAATTGDPLVFPYQAFAPADGVGFGRREILGHGADYTPSLALRSNAQVLERLFADWVVAGPVGTALAAVGVCALARSWRRAASPPERRRVGRRAVLAGLFVSVPLGNLAFWGNYNVLGNLDVETDGLIHYLGPYYHYDLLVPTAVFAAVGVGLLASHLRAATRRAFDRETARRAFVAALVVAAAAFGGLAAAEAADPLDRNRAVGQELAQGYEPFADEPAPADAADAPPEDAVVFLPPIYGPWLNHPLQALRNDPGYGGDRVYALGDTRELDVAEAFPERSLYRYVFVGSWTPVDDRSVEADLRRVDRVAGERVVLDATVDLPERARAVSVLVETDAGRASFVANGTPRSLPLSLTVGDGALSVASPALDASGAESVSLAARDEVRLTAYVETGASSGFTYRVVFPVASDGERVRALSPTREWCRVPTQCRPVGFENDPPGVDVETAMRAEAENGTATDPG